MSPRVPFPPQADPRLRAPWNKLQTEGGGGAASLLYKLNFGAEFEAASVGPLLGFGPSVGTNTLFEGVAQSPVPIMADRDLQLTSMTVAVNVAPGAGQTFTAQLILNGAPTGLTVTLSESQTRDSVAANVNVTAGDLISLNIVNSADSVSRSCAIEAHGAYTES